MTSNADYDRFKTTTLNALLARLKIATDDEVTGLFRNGTIWVFSEHLFERSVFDSSFIFLGAKLDGITRHLSEGYTLLVDYCGMVDGGILRTEIASLASDEEIEAQCGGLPLLSVEEVKMQLMEEANFDANDVLENIRWMLDTARCDSQK